MGKTGAISVSVCIQNCSILRKRNEGKLGGESQKVDDVAFF